MDEIFQIAKLLKSNREDDPDDDSKVEVEFRFKDVSKERFSRCMKYACRNFKKIDEYSYKEERVQIVGKTKCVHRKIERCGYPKDTISKTQIKVVHMSWVSLHLSIEQEIRNMKSSYSNPTFKNRTSFLLDDGTARLDLTTNDDLYQIEIEILDLLWDSDETIKKMVVAFLDTSLYISKNLYDCVSEIASYRHYYDDKEYFCISRRKYQTPKTLRIKDYCSIYEDKRFVTPKLDGVRRFLILFSSQCFSVDLLGEIRKEETRISYDHSKHCILDCEFAKGAYNIIDVVVLMGEYVGSRYDPIERLRRFSDDYDTSDCPGKIYVEVTENPFPTILEWRSKYDIDGAVLIGRDYMSDCLKVKFDITVDLYVDDDKNLVSSDGKTIPRNIDVEGYMEKGCIYEFTVCDGNKLRVLRKREDKPTPNSSSVISANMSKDVGTMDLFLGKGCLMMRRVHNTIKTLMYEMAFAKGSVILDIGSGQGGDVSKWVGSKKVFVVEPDADALKELKRRRRQYKRGLDVKIIKQRTSSYSSVLRSIGDVKVDVISVFFCLNLFREDDIVGLLEIVEESSSQDCRIIGTYMEVTSYDSNECYTIRGVNEEEYLIRLDDTRVDQIERNFDFSSFEKNLRKMDFTVTFKSRLDRMDMGFSDNERALSRMFWSFEFRNKKGPYKWLKEDRRPIEEKVSLDGIATISLDDDNSVLEVSRGDECYFRKGGVILDKEVTDQELMMSILRL